MPRSAAPQQPEPLWYLKSLPYSEYRQSVVWRKRRDLVRAQRDACELCGLAPRWDFTVRFHVHHLSYERLGEERDEDLMLVCAPCHNLIHFPDSEAATVWLRIVRSWGMSDIWERSVSARPSAAAVGDPVDPW